MKSFLKAIFTEKQWEKLSKIKKKFYKYILVSIIKIFPDRVLLDVKSIAEIKRKMDYGRHEIFLNIDSEIELNVRLHSCEKEPEIVKWIETFFTKGDVFYDIGANVGAYSLVAAKYLSKKIKIYAFEPGFINFVQLCKNTFMNNCQEDIIPLQIALSDKTGINIFNYNNLSSGGALHTLGQPIDFKGSIFEPVFRQLILSYRIDDFVRQFNLPIPNHIKIDVDGIEFEILKGAGEILRSSLVKSVFVELQEGEEKSEKTISFLLNKGFKFYSKHRYVYGNPTGPTTKNYNYIFKKTHDS